MGLMDSLKEILGVTPVNIGDLNRRAACQSRPSGHSGDSLNPPGDIEVTGEYRQVHALLEKGCPMVFVSGKAGTGKTTLVHFLREKLDKNIVVVAPTGVAALNVKGTTIHSFFRFPPRMIAEEDIKEVRNRRVYEKIDILIIDEISMVRADLLDAMDEFLRLNGPAAHKPFGGVQVLFVGDLFQLPPVVKSKEEVILKARQYATPFFFSAKVLQGCEFAPVELSKIYRQTDAQFAEMLNRMRVAEELEFVVPFMNQNCYGRSDGRPSLITLTCTNAAADQINTSGLHGLPGETKTLTGEVSGKFAVQDEKLPSPLKLQLKAGAQVMFTKNDEQKRWVNGTIGRVTDFAKDVVRVELLSEGSGTVHDVRRARWESFKYEYDPVKDKIKPVTVGEYIQFPLMLAWAVTIHKSQGKTLERVNVDLGDGAFAPGQVYVALSRCRSLQDIRLARPIGRTEIKCDPRIKRFYQALARTQGIIKTDTNSLEVSGHE